MRDKKILFATIMAATAVASFIFFISRKKRRFNHHKTIYTPTKGVSEWEFTV